MKKPSLELESFSKVNGGKAGAAKIINDWFVENYIRNNQPNPTKKDELVEKYEIKKYPYFSPCKIYSFIYDPKHKEEYESYDKNPMLLSFGHVQVKKGYLEQGINLHCLPEKYRERVLDFMWEFFEDDIVFNSKKIEDNKNDEQKIIQVQKQYEKVKALLQDTNFEFAFRSYTPKKMITFPKIVTYSDWFKTIYLNSNAFSGTDFNTVQKEFFEDLKS